MLSIYIYIYIEYRKPCFPKIRLFEAQYKKGAMFPRHEKCVRYRCVQLKTIGRMNVKERIPVCGV